VLPSNTSQYYKRALSLFFLFHLTRLSQNQRNEKRSQSSLLRRHHVYNGVALEASVLPYDIIAGLLCSNARCGENAASPIVA
jgi:hypothetical protein